MLFHYFNSSHWDREWYAPFEAFRFDLVRMTGNMLDALEAPDGPEKFTFDGQTVVLEDVCAIRPEWRERFVRLIGEGKLKVGPWYVMPDEFLVSGEALIRNLLIGRRVAAEFGGAAWPVGYACDIFGHIAQLPQIFRGFGLKLAVAWRGIDPDAPQFLRWRAPDGSEIPTLHLAPEDAYCNFTANVSGWWDLPVAEDVFRKRMAAFMAKHTGPVLVLMDAWDHCDCHRQAPEFLRWIRAMYPESEVVHGDLVALAEFCDETAPVIHGEQLATARDSAAMLIPHTVSSRYDLKQANDRCQNRLELLLEPAAATGALHPDTRPFLAYAWKELVKNHAHDSICGCSVDAVHRQMTARFAAIEQLEDRLEFELIRADRERAGGRALEYEAQFFAPEPDPLAGVNADGNYVWRIYNPLPWRRRVTLCRDLALPAVPAYPRRRSEPFGYEALANFRLFASDGREIEYQLGPVRRQQEKRFYRQDLRQYDMYPVSCSLELAPSGWSTVELRPAEKPVRFFASLRTAPLTAANDRLQLTLAPAGTLELTDRATGRTFKNLLTLTLDREIGDGWNHVAPAGTPESWSAAVIDSVRVLADGPVRTVFEVRGRLSAPRELIWQGTMNEKFSGIAESADWGALDFRHELTLDRNGSALRVKTVIANGLKDCRLRLAIPTGAGAGDCFAYQNFTFVTRAPGRDGGTSDYVEADPPEKNFSRIAGRRDASGCGLALLDGGGLHEVAATDVFDGGEMLVTLFRAFRRTVGANGMETDGQLQRELVFEYALRPLGPEDDNAGLFRQWQELFTPTVDYLRPVTADETPTDIPGWEFSGDLSFSALKPAEDASGGAVIFRAVNLTEKEASGTLCWPSPGRCVTPVAPDETASGEETQENVNSITFSAPPGKIISHQIRCPSDR